VVEAHLWAGGRVFTGARYEEALLVEDGRVVAAGNATAVRSQAPTGADRHDLAGRLIVPGLIDAHLHLSEIARLREGLDLRATASRDALIAAVARWSEEHGSGPIVGRGWDPERWADRRWPAASDLDRVLKDRPVILYHASGHAAVVNTVALGVARLEAAAPAPDDPSIGRQGDGRPSGILFDEAMRPLARLAHDATPVGSEQLGRTVQDLPSVGLTAVGTMGASPDEVASLAELDRAGKLAFPVRAYVRLEELASAPRAGGSPASHRFGVAGVKAYLDGAFGTRTAWLSAPYTDATGTSGIAVGDEATLAQELEEAAEMGLAPALHAIGDQALARALRLLAPLAGRTAAPGRVEHAALTPPALLAELDRVRPMLVVQPGFIWSDGWLSDRLGTERGRWAYALRSLLDRGLPMAGSSDAPFDPVDPWRGMRAAVGRRDPAGRSANPDPGEALSPEEALGVYSLGSAMALGLGDRGRLVAGAPADLVVLRHGALAAALATPGNPVAETWVDGRKVFGALGPPPQ
jgi:predicted amidohydrolase YtcJ